MTAVPELPAAPALIGGEELTVPSAPVINPARVNEVVGEYALGTRHHVDSAVAAFPAWSALPAAERAGYLLRAAAELDAQVPGWAELLTREVGKVLPEFRGDAAGAPALIRYFASLAPDIDTERQAALPLAGRAVLRHVPTGPDAPLVTAEQFGPIIPVLPFSDEDEAVRLANDTEYGLAASVWSDDSERAWQLGRRHAAGSVFVNVHRVGASPVPLPFGGFKQSGTGRNHGIESVFACMEPQAVVEFDDPGALPGTDHWNTLLKTADDKGVSE